MGKKDRTTSIDAIAESSSAGVGSGVVMADHLASADWVDDISLEHGVAGTAGSSKFVDNGCKVLQVVQVQLVYWGAAWISSPAPTPSSDAITSSVATMLTGPYLTGLEQYRGIGRGFLRGATVVSNSTPPNGFTDGQVSTFINNQINAGTLPTPDADNGTLYMVVMPQGVNSQNTSFVGEHTYFTRNSQRIPFSWITNNGSLGSVTRIISHEIVEASTDPEGGAFLGVAGTCSQGGWCEIGDICSSTQVRDGVTVQSFWSDQDNACIVPSWPNRAYPRRGVQFTGTLPAGATGRWFTFNWPEWEWVEWRILPTTPRNGSPQVRWKVSIERAAGSYLTYWISVTNLTSVAMSFQAEYAVLGRS
jgi:hypothetical protein